MSEAFTWVHADDQLQPPALIRLLNTAFPRIARLLKPNAQIFTGTGSPNGVYTASPGALFLRTDGGAGTSSYVKVTGVNTNTGWEGGPSHMYDVLAYGAKGDGTTDDRAAIQAAIAAVPIAGSLRGGIVY